MSQLATLTLITPRELAVAKANGRLQGAGVVLAAVLLGLMLSRYAALDVEQQMAEAQAEETRLALAAARNGQPCLDQLPMRKVITQALVDQLCIKPQPLRRAVTGART